MDFNGFQWILTDDFPETVGNVMSSQLTNTNQNDFSEG